MEFENQYLTYNDYKILGGQLEEKPFNVLEYKAQKIVDKYTFGRLKNLKEQVQEVKMCIYDLINSLKSTSSIVNNNSNVASENIDGYSVSYLNNNQEEADKEYKSLIIDYLSSCKLEDGTPYLYSGVDYDN